MEAPWSQGMLRGCERLAVRACGDVRHTHACARTVDGSCPPTAVAPGMCSRDQLASRLEGQAPLGDLGGLWGA
eukprot:15445633-Alexandrium_andersonii.AAC.1